MSFISREAGYLSKYLQYLSASHPHHKYKKKKLVAKSNNLPSSNDKNPESRRGSSNSFTQTGHVGHSSIHPSIGINLAAPVPTNNFLVVRRFLSIFPSIKYSTQINLTITLLIAPQEYRSRGTIKPNCGLLCLTSFLTSVTCMASGGGGNAMRCAMTLCLAKRSRPLDCRRMGSVDPLIPTVLRLPCATGGWRDGMV